MNILENLVLVIFGSYGILGKNWLRAVVYRIISIPQMISSSYIVYSDQFYLYILKF